MAQCTRQRLPLPYSVPADQLPAPLPSFEEIVSSGREYLCRPNGGRHVVRVGKYFMVKYGVTVAPQEVKNMLFIQHNCPEVRLPKVYALYQQQVSSSSSSDGNPRLLTVIIMEYIPGNCLARQINRLDRSQRRTVAEGLAAQLAALRRIPQESSPAYYGALGGRPLRNSFWSSDPGPFASAGAYADALFRLECPVDPRYEPALVAKMGECREKFGRISKGKAIARGERDVPVFTHADLHAGNVVLRLGDDGDGDTYVPFIIDWESAGWHPPYWEYACTFDSVPEWSPWCKMAGRILDDYSVERDILEHVRWMYRHRMELGDA